MSLTLLACNFWVFLLFVSLDPYSYVSASPEEAAAIFQWKMDSGNKNNPFIKSWDGVSTSSSNPCSWFGVTCNMDSSHITALNLTNCGLSGTLLNFPFSSLPNLECLDLSKNQLSGPIPKQLSNLSCLTHLSLDSNQFVGPIPEEVGHLNLNYLSLSDNSLNGTIPISFDNMTNLEVLILYTNLLSGSITHRFQKLDKLYRLALGHNRLIGRLPEQLCSSKQLQSICVSGNNLTGTIPESLKNCTTLVRARFDGNQFTGNLSEIFGAYPVLDFMELSGNRFYGELSTNWAKCKNLTSLQMAGNNITGSIPHELGELSKLVRLDLSSNHLTGVIPKELGELKSMIYLNLQGNHLEGPIPRELGSLTELLQLDLSSNLLNGSIPRSIGTSQQLTYLNFSNNFFIGEILPETGNLIQLSQLDLGYNQFTGKIPSTLNNLQKLELLNLSHNHLSGQIPKVLGDMPALSNLDISFNNLEGPVPIGRFLENLTLKQVEGNPDLCGNITGLRPCQILPSKRSSKKLVFEIVFPLLGSLTILCIVIVILAGCFKKRKPNADDGENTETVNNGNFFSICIFDGKEMYKKILEATEEFSQAYSIGEGGSGHVYKAQLSPTQVVAVKRLHALPNESERNDFLNEIRALTVIKHRNIVKLLGFCSSDRHSFLIYEYLERGSLANILSRDEAAVNLDWKKRVNIIKGIANALSYMHHDCSPPIVHRDISSKNILLDSEFEACVSDFGTSRFLKADSSNLNSMGVVGTFGYMAPELAYSAKVTDKCDVFSFGVLTLEIIRGAFPSNYIADQTVEIQLNELIDYRLSYPVPKVENILASIIDLARRCLNVNPVSRPTMEMVSNSLQKMGWLS